MCQNHMGNPVRSPRANRSRTLFHENSPAEYHSGNPCGKKRLKIQLILI